MATERLLDAEALLAGERWDYAYYVSGYAVECALKSCVLARMVVTGLIYRSEKPINFQIHDFDKLIDLAGMRDELNGELEASAAAGGDFVRNWNAVRAWNVESRYKPHSEDDARNLYAAITHETWGMLRWLKNYW